MLINFKVKHRSKLKIWIIDAEGGISVVRVGQVQQIMMTAEQRSAAKEKRLLDNASGWWGTHDGERSVYYDAQENPLQTLMRIQHTMLGTTLTDPLYHLLILIHVCIMYFNDEMQEVPTLDTSILVGLPAALHIFLVIFYVSECYRRYYELWSHCSAVNTMVYT